MNQLFKGLHQDADMVLQRMADYRNYESDKRKYSEKRRKVKEHTINHHLSNHLCDLAEFHIKGIVCEKNNTYAKELLQEAI
ncbi:MAG: hypothetical protein P8O76_03705 [Methylophilaceae bacterium]|nr:hypothetical protein [Methylophilaceae bacterium]